MSNTIKLRRGTASQWTSANPVLLDGEPGFETDTNKFKIGTGTASWSNLPYAAIDPPTASSIYASISYVEANYLSKSASLNLEGYLTEANASATYLPISASVNYLLNSEASNIYLRQDTASSIYATINSPSFTGTPLAPTAASGTNTTQIATTAFVRTEISNLVDSAPSTLDTLNELAAALNDDPNFATTITNSIGTKLDASTASTLYLPISSSSNYLFTTTAAETYLRQDTASLTYLRQDTASATYLPISGSVNWSNINNKPDPVITLQGDVSGSGTLTDLNSASISVTVEKDFSLTFTGDVTGSATVDNLGSASIALTVAPNSVALGTDTTGNYVAGLTAGNGISISGTAEEGWSPTVTLDTATASVNWANVNNKPDPVITLGGDLSGSVTLTDLTNGTLNATIVANSVALGTDTTGNYVADITAGNGITITGAAGEGWAPTIEINSATASVTFANITSKPTTLSGYGITDALPASASSNFVQVNISTNAQTASAYTLALSDAGKLVEMNNANANTLIIPLNSSIAFPTGTKIDILQTGAGQTTASAVSGVTINSSGGARKLSGQWSAATLIKRGTDTWVLIGDLSA